MAHYVYIVECKDTTLYTGYSTNPYMRVEIHNKGKGAKYTKPRLPVKLIFIKKFDTKREAMKEEYKIKKLSRQQKIKLANA
ncbi:MAG: GIY-YIG nuclease family protein [Patescibacteria group bacterium]